jgi:hypothetical protein
MAEIRQFTIYNLGGKAIIFVLEASTTLSRLTFFLCIFAPADGAVPTNFFTDLRVLLESSPIIGG